MLGGGTGVTLTQPWLLALFTCFSLACSRRSNCGNGPKRYMSMKNGKGLHCPIPSKWQAKQGWGMIGRTTEHVQECCASLYLRSVRTRQKVAAPCCSDKSLLAATTGSCPTFIQSDPALWHFYCYCNLLPSVFQPSLKKPRIINSLCMQCVDHSSLQTRVAHIYFKSMGLFLWDHPDHSEHSTLKELTNSPYTVYSLLMDTSIWRTSL